jgi:hypothetical protein
MLSYLYNSHHVVAAWVAQRIPHCRRGWEACRAIGIADDDDLIAGLVYHNWEPEAGIMEISSAAVPGSGWYTRETMARHYQYPFLQCQCQMVVVRVKASDERLLRMFAVQGYAFVKIARLFGRNEDGVVGTLTYEDWANNKFNKRFGHHHEVFSERLAAA